MDWPFALRLEHFFDLFGHGVDLPAALRCAEDEIVCKVADVPDVQEDDVGGLLFGRRFYGFSR